MTTDRVGAIEAAGVEYLPEDARDSRPRNLGAVFLGANLTWTNVVFGAFAILFGLSFWQTVASMVVGTAIGTLAVMPTAIIGPRTGTNMTVSSGAFFGIRGRFIGSGIALAIALAFAAVTVWTSGDALVAAGHRLLGTPENDVVHAIAYAAVAALMVTVALYGHATIVAMQKIVVPVVGTLMILGVVRVRGRIRPQRASGGEYALGGFWQTWALSAVLFAAAPISYGPTIGDYTRRISAAPLQRPADLRGAGDRHVRRRAAAQPVRRVHRGDVRQPDRFLPRRSGRRLPRLVRAADRRHLAAGRAEPGRAVHLRERPRPGRPCAAAEADPDHHHHRGVAIVLLYVGVFVFDAVESVTAMTVALNAVITPWVAILAIGALRTKSYDPTDLQAFAHGRRGGRYWFTGGWNVPAVVAWAVGATFGVLAVNTTLYVGPLADIAGGVDLSTIGSAVLAGLIYAVSLGSIKR